MSKGLVPGPSKGIYMDLKAYLKDNASWSTRRWIVSSRRGANFPPRCTAMRYSVFAGGKRVRPVLILAACESVGGSTAGACRPPAPWR